MKKKSFIYKETKQNKTNIVFNDSCIIVQFSEVECPVLKLNSLPQGIDSQVQFTVDQLNSSSDLFVCFLSSTDWLNDAVVKFNSLIQWSTSWVQITASMIKFNKSNHWFTDPIIKFNSLIQSSGSWVTLTDSMICVSWT